MKHAGAETLRALDKLLVGIRKCELNEIKPGIFYQKRTAFLHFHEDPAGLFADVKMLSAYRRYPVNSRAQQHALLKVIKEQLKQT